jgi:hypothetical protein
VELFTKYKDVEVMYSLVKDGSKFIKARQRLEEFDICPLCKMQIKPSSCGELILFYNNFKLFPNTIVHEACCRAFGNTLSKEGVVKRLSEDFNEAKNYKCWKKYL